MTVSEEREDWDNGTNWRGLGLTDPIKSVEVREVALRSYGIFLMHKFSSRTSGCCFRPF